MYHVNKTSIPPNCLFLLFTTTEKKKICKFPWIPNLYWNFHTMSGTEPPARSWQQSLITVGAVQSWPPRVTQLRGSCSGNRRGGEWEGCGEGAEGGPRQRTFPAPGIGAYTLSAWYILTDQKNQAEVPAESLFCQAMTHIQKITEHNA